jgi:PPOX class probable F420-dependent enzyme
MSARSAGHAPAGTITATGWAADPDALADFLAEPNLCRLATVDEDGAAHVVPAWFWWDGRRLWIGAQADDHKVANVQRTGRASVEVDSDLRRKRGILARGAARVIGGADGRREYVRVSAEQVRRYQPDRPPLETAERMATKGTPVVVEVTPTSIVGWGR